MATATNLPAELTSFVGREPQLVDLRRLLHRSRLITLTGPGGVGKSRLALKLAAESVKKYAGGVWLLDLAPVIDGRLLEHALAAACGIKEDSNRTILEVLAERLKDSRGLILLDGCEHVVDVCAELTGHLLQSCRKLSVLATSREPLGVTGEVIWRTPPLTTPRPEDMGRPELLMEREAVRLFVDRARLSQPGLELQVPNAAAIAQICNRLEGIPLAIELAAGLAGVMSLEEILGRLRYRFKLLTGGNRGSAPRHQTLRQAVDWSYCLLGPHEQSVFARLGVFAGGFDLPAAEAVVDGDGVDVDDVPSIVSRLANKSLLVAEPTHPHLTRYRMLDTIRDYAVEKLDGHIDTEARQRQARYYLDWCAAATKELSSPDQIAWLNRLDEESPNIRAALEWMLPRQPDDALRLAASLGRYWYMRRRLAEGADWLDHALEATPTPSEGRARGLLAVARLRSRAGEFDRARKDLKECIGLSRRLGLESELARALTLEGVASGYARDWAPALEHFTEALALLRKLGDRIGIIGSLNNLAMVSSECGHQEEAQSFIDEASLLAESLGDRLVVAMLVESAGRIALRSGDFTVARRRFEEALTTAAESEDALNIASCLEGLALVTVHDGLAVRAITLFSAGQRIRASTGTLPTPGWSSDVTAGLAASRAKVSPQAANDAWLRGASMSLHGAARLGLRQSAERRHNGGTPLTARELEVARLISTGLTNPQLAMRLRIANRTADAHVEHIRNKLGLRTRSQIAIWAHERLAESSTD